MADQSSTPRNAGRGSGPAGSEPGPAPPEPGPARLFALVAGAGLALLGVLGFFHDAGFATGTRLAADDIAGVIVVNGWRNVVYLTTGVLALGFAARYPRPTAAALGAFYAIYGVWGLAQTSEDIGSILEILPLTDNDNVLHLAIGGLGLLAALVDGPLPKSRSDKRDSGDRRRRGLKPTGPPRRSG